MKKLFPVIVVILLAMVIWNLAAPDLSFYWDDGDVDGPLGALLALVLGGGGLVIGALVMVFVAVVLACVFAGLGILAVCGLGVGALVLAALLSPLLLPLLIPLAIVWFLVSRARRNRAREQAR